MMFGVRGYSSVVDAGVQEGWLRYASLGEGGLLWRLWLLHVICHKGFLYCLFLKDGVAYPNLPIRYALRSLGMTPPLRTARIRLPWHGHCACMSTSTNE